MVWLHAVICQDHWVEITVYFRYKIKKSRPGCFIKILASNIIMIMHVGITTAKLIMGT